MQVGVVEFDTREDLKAAIRDLDGGWSCFGCPPPHVHYASLRFSIAISYRSQSFSLWQRGCICGAVM